MSALIVTLAVDELSQGFFDRLRTAEFPRARNHLAAHVTLFHALPDDVHRIVGDVTGAAARTPFEVAVTGLRFLGAGVAYALSSPDLDDLRAGLAARWRDDLTRQDRQPHRAHITVQNKVTPALARETYARLGSQPLPPPITAVGISVWRYLAGPWEPIARVDLRAR